jgi:hypothetical protein
VEEETQAQEPTLEWTPPDQLAILCPRCRATTVRKHEGRWGPIPVRYQLQP